MRRWLSENVPCGFWHTWSVGEKQAFASQLLRWYYWIQPPWRRTGQTAGAEHDVPLLLRAPLKSKPTPAECLMQLHESLGYRGPHGIALFVTGLIWWANLLPVNDSGGATRIAALAGDLTWVLEQLCRS